jgi:hypothetical protein
MQEVDQAPSIHGQSTLKMDFKPAINCAGRSAAATGKHLTALLSFGSMHICEKASA